MESRLAVALLTSITQGLRLWCLSYIQHMTSKFLLSAPTPEEKSLEESGLPWCEWTGCSLYEIYD